MAKYTSHVSTKKTPQSQPIMGKPMVKNSAGGFSFAVDDWTRLNRFLILGNEGGSYYASEKKMTIENAECVNRCFAADPKRTIDVIVSISDEGRAPKNDPAIFALAMCCVPPTLDNKDTKHDAFLRDSTQYALDAIPKVCRIGTHIFQFVDAVQHFCGWRRALRRAVAKWYEAKDGKDLAFQVTKYWNREGWNHHDLMHRCHPRPQDDVQRAVFGYAKVRAHGKSMADFHDVSFKSKGLPEIVSVVESVKCMSNPAQIVHAIEGYGLVREHIPTEWLNNVSVWEALLQKMPLTAMVRNLGKMSSIGLLTPLSNASKLVASKLSDQASIIKQRIHPLKLLVAQKIYAQGHGDKGSLKWNPVPQVTDALDAAFYKAFKAVEPTGKNWLLALDVSASMTWNGIAGMSGITPREASGALSLVTANVEPNYHICAFSSSRGTREGTFMMPCNLSKSMRLNEVLHSVGSMTPGGTDCALPMIYALTNKIPVDMFVIYTDSETWAGDIHPCQALNEYRNKTGIPAKLVVCGMESNGFTIADPNDAGMMDVVGFDTAIPEIMRDFAIH